MYSAGAWPLIATGTRWINHKIVVMAWNAVTALCHNFCDTTIRCSDNVI